MGLSCFEKRERLLKRKEFRDINLGAKRYRTNNFLVLLKPNKRISSRLGITVGKKAGNAVKRNRTKRLIREFFRQNKFAIPQGNDIHIIALNCDQPGDYHKVREELGRLLFKNAQDAS